MISRSSADLLRRMVTQYVSIAINNGSTIGSTILSTPLDRTLPIWIERLGDNEGTAAYWITGMSADNQVDAQRSSSVTNLVIYLGVIGVPK
jgi:hypothetical protein